MFAVYLFGSTITMPVYGRLADVHGRRRMLLLAVALFPGSSLLCALARTMPQLIAARGLQGLGAGGLIPLALTGPGDLYSMEERARIQGLFSSIWGVSSLVGPLAGAFLTMTAGWRSIFLLNLPLGVLAAWIVATRMIETPGARARGGGGPGRPGAPAPARDGEALRVGGAHGDLAVRRVDVRPSLRAGRARRHGGLGRRGRDAAHPVLGGVRDGGRAPHPARRVPAVGAPRRGLLVLGFAGLIAAVALDASTAWISAACAVVGCGLGPTALSQLLAVQEDAPAEQRGVATSLVPFFRTVGGSLGVAAMGGVLAAGLSARLGPALESASRALSGEIPASPLFRAALERSLLPVFAALLAAAVCAVFAAARFPAGRHRPGGAAAAD